MTITKANFVFSYPSLNWTGRYKPKNTEITKNVSIGIPNYNAPSLGKTNVSMKKIIQHTA